MGIELFRGLAALMVLITHYAAFASAGPNGLEFLWTGVDLFFVISGFVFAPLLLGEGGKSGDTGRQLAVRAFFIRRFFRIYPLYLLALLAYYLSMPDVAEKTTYLIRHLFFLHTTRSFEEAYFFNPAFWSLPVEIEFYLLLPLLALLGGHKRWLALVFAGTLLYHFVQRGQQVGLPWHHRGALLGLLAGGLLLGFGYVAKYGGLGLETSRVLDAPFNFLCACGYALVMYPVLLIPETAWQPGAVRLAWFGGASSYGVYLFHNLSPKLLQAAGMQPRGLAFVLLATLLTYAIATLLYHCYENPLRNLGRKLGRRQAAGKAMLSQPTPP